MSTVLSSTAAMPTLALARARTPRGLAETYERGHDNGGVLH